MNVEVKQAPYSEHSVLRKMMQLYVYDFTEFIGGDLDEHGEFGYHYMDHYWAEDDRETRVPFLIRADGKLAGFALVRREGDGPWKMAEFFILKRYRRGAVGSAAARTIFEQFPGAWEVHEVAANTPAQAFWRRIIGEITNGAFEERSDGGGVVQKFSLPRHI